MSNRIYFNAWGYGEDHKMPAYAMMQWRDTNKGSAIARAIARKNKMVVANVKPEGYDPGANKRHWQITIGKPVKGGGVNPQMVVWVAA